MTQYKWLILTICWADWCHHAQIKNISITQTGVTTDFISSTTTYIIWSKLSRETLSYNHICILYIDQLYKFEAISWLALYLISGKSKLSLTTISVQFMVCRYIGARITKPYLHHHHRYCWCHHKYYSKSIIDIWPSMRCLVPRTLMFSIFSLLS